MAESETWAGEEAPTAAAPSQESVRLDLGLRLNGLGGVGQQPQLMPIAILAFEAHMAGPAWFLIAGNGGYALQSTDDDGGSRSWNVALRAGPRLQWPVVDRVDAGGYLLVSGGASSFLVGREGNLVYEGKAYQIGGVLGGSIHFRATPLFGVRLALDLVEAGYQVIQADFDTTGGFAGFNPSPSAELTFTF